MSLSARLQLLLAGLALLAAATSAITFDKQDQTQATKVLSAEARAGR
jgi:cell division protein FtsB